MAIVKTAKIGNTTILFDDKYVVKTEEEVNSILNRISRIYSDCLLRTDNLKTTPPVKFTS